MSQETFTAKQAADLCGLPYPTVSFLRNQGLFLPSVRIGGNRGAASVYSLDDVVALRAIAQIRTTPATFESLANVLSFWKSVEAHDLVRACREAKHPDELPEKRLLVITAAGTVTLTDVSNLFELFVHFNSSVLHVVDVGRVFADVLVEHVERRLTGLHVEHGPNGRELRAPRKRGTTPRDARLGVVDNAASASGAARRKKGALR